MILPRNNFEVTVDFTLGDVDRPFVTGHLYNGLQKPPYALPAGATRSSIQSATTSGGAGANELRFEDSAGAEEIFLNASKDYTLSVDNDSSVHVKANETFKVGSNNQLSVGADHGMSVQGSRTLSVGASRGDQRRRRSLGRRGRGRNPRHRRYAPRQMRRRPRRERRGYAQPHRRLASERHRHRRLHASDQGGLDDQGRCGVGGSRWLGPVERLQRRAQGDHRGSQVREGQGHVDQRGRGVHGQRRRIQGDVRRRADRQRDGSRVGRSGGGGGASKRQTSRSWRTTSSFSSPAAPR